MTVPFTMKRSIGSKLRTAISGVAVAFALVVALFANPSHAAASGPLYAGFGLGPYWYLDYDYTEVHFRPQFEFGIHFSRDDTGFFIAFEAIPTVGDNFIMFFGGMRLGGDIEVFANRDIGVILRPSALLGGGIVDFEGPRNDSGFFVMQPAFELRLAVADRLLHIWLRPIGFDLMFHPDYFGTDDFEFDAGYAFMSGLDFNF